MSKNTEIEGKVDLSIIRYSQCWEDTDILLEGLDIKENNICLSIGSAGDNSFSMLTKNPSVVYAIDLSKSQIYLIELKKVMYKYLSYEEFIFFIGNPDKNIINEIEKRVEIYNRYSKYLENEVKEYWDLNIKDIGIGVMHIGKFEKFFKIIREKIIPIIHRKKTVDQLLEKKSYDERKTFFEKKWETIRWKILLKIFFNRSFIGKKGRDPEFFKYVDSKVKISEHVNNRMKSAVVTQDPSENSYLQYILKGYYYDKLPFAYRKENFEIIKNNIDKIICINKTIEEFLRNSQYKIDCFNLSDIFEYMPEKNYIDLYKNIIVSSSDNSRVCYWNLFVTRKNHIKLMDKVNYLKEKSKDLYEKDKTFFYSDFIVDIIK